MEKGEKMAISQSVQKIQVDENSVEFLVTVALQTPGPRKFWKNSSHKPKERIYVSC
jgi:hypothetical protein